MKEEFTAGAHGVETRYPFLDREVVQEYLWLTGEVKNREYKGVIGDAFRSIEGRGYGWGRGKMGFIPM